MPRYYIKTIIMLYIHDILKGVKEMEEIIKNDLINTIRLMHKKIGIDTGIYNYNNMSIPALRLLRNNLISPYNEAIQKETIK